MTLHAVCITYAAVLQNNSREYSFPSRMPTLTHIILVLRESLRPSDNGMGLTIFIYLYIIKGMDINDSVIYTYRAV